MSIEETDKLRRDSYVLTIKLIEEEIANLDRTRGAYAAAVSALRRYIVETETPPPVAEGFDGAASLPAGELKP